MPVSLPAAMCSSWLALDPGFFRRHVSQETIRRKSVSINAASALQRQKDEKASILAEERAIMSCFQQCPQLKGWKAIQISQSEARGESSSVHLS